MSGKLIRDYMPELLGWAGVSSLSNETHQAALRTNIGEEMAEYLAATSAEHRRAELTDVLEVVLALAAQDDLTPADLGAEREAKATERGGFAARLYWTPD